jgi:CubicO group peptidase (beta-lactamase class C family)
MPIITGYPAKYLCSAVFISNRNAVDVENLDLNFSFIKYVDNEVDYTNKTVTSRFLWGSAKAIYKDGFGAVLLNKTDEARLLQRQFPSLPRLSFSQDTMNWPVGNVIPDSVTGIDKIALRHISKNLIDLSTYNGNAFAFLVLHKGIPVVEGYRSGFNEKTRFLSWSMAKSFTSALAGIMVKDGLLRLEQESGIPEWQSDERKKITLNDLLQMQSGLEWNEDYGNRSDVTLMLYNHRDFAGFALNQKLAFPAGTHWYYSSGTTNIVNLIMRNQFNSDSAYYSYAPQQLFRKTGMTSAIFETDAAGTLVGSSYVYATARDYARFGLLYLLNGVFNGERILPEGWVKYSTTPAKNSKGAYGAFFWLNKGKKYPDAPADMFSCNGHDGQRIFIIPSKELVVVVLGYSPKHANEMDFNRLLKDIFRAQNQ